MGLTTCATHRPLPPAARVPNLREELAERVAAQQTLRVLFIGNSYSFGLPEAFAKIATDHGKSVKTGHSTFGGWTLAQHAGHQGTLQKIRSGGWDIVVIQEQSLIPAQPSRKRSAAMFEPLRFLANEARSHGAIPLLYQTWGRRDGNAQLKDDTFPKMTARVRDSYQAAAIHAGGVLIAPVGDAWEQEMNAGRGAQLFIEDGSHPSARGVILTAETFYRTVFGP